MSRFLQITILARGLFNEIVCGQCNLIQVSALRTTPVLLKPRHKKFKWKKFWRTKDKPIVGLSPAYGPFTDLPDYSYLDGRPTPLSIGQQRRRLERIQATSLIMESLEDIARAETMHRDQIEARQADRQQKIDAKLTPKGEDNLS